MIIAIHQPNFFPWLGYFNKISRADRFVFLDHVQFPRKGAGTWVNRVKILIQGKEAWITVPVARKDMGLAAINDVTISSDPKWRKKIINSIDFNYKKAGYYDEVRDFLIGLINESSDKLSIYNCRNILAVSKLLGVDENKFVRSSDLNVPGKSTELLVNITRAVGGNAYMCGSGAKGYQQDELFEKQGLQLIYQDFKHPEYTQVNAKEFVPGLSIIDALVNAGIEGTKKMLNG